MTAIKITNLTKRYPKKATPALDDLSLSVDAGEIFGYLGPNGAGKTTTIRIMLDFIRPTAGMVSIMGLDAQRDAQQIHARIGNLPGELRLWEHMTGHQTLDYLVRLRPGCDLNYAYELAERLSLKLDVKTVNYSTGNKRKLGIIQAMMHRPQVLILDEPTTGLDPLVRHVFHDLLREIRDEGRTVFLSSHVLSEVQNVCDRVAILRNGQLQTIRDIEELQHSIERIVTVYSKEPLDAQAWATIEGVQRSEPGAGFLRLYVAGSMDALIKHAAKFTIDEMRVDMPTLETVFMEYYAE